MTKRSPVVKIGGMEVEVQLDRSRTLRYDWPALAALNRELRKATGRHLVPLLREEGEDIFQDFDILQMLLWAGLRWRDPKLTPEGAGRLVQQVADKGGDQANIWDAVRRALMGCGLFRQANSQQENGEDLSPDPTPAPTETPS